METTCLDTICGAVQKTSSIFQTAVWQSFAHRTGMLHSHALLPKVHFGTHGHDIARISVPQRLVCIQGIENMLHCTALQKSETQC